MFARRSLVLVNQARPTVHRVMFSSYDWKDKERGEEKNYFSKKDAELLRKLASKLDGDHTQDPETVEAICHDLDRIFEHHNLDK